MGKMRGLIVWLVVGIFLVIGLEFTFPQNAEGKVMPESWLSVSPEHPSTTKYVTVDNGVSEFKLQITFLRVSKRILLIATGEDIDKVVPMSWFQWTEGNRFFKDETNYQVHGQPIEYRVIDFNFSDKASLNYLKVVIQIPDSCYDRIKEDREPLPKLLMWGGRIMIKFSPEAISEVKEN